MYPLVHKTIVYKTAEYKKTFGTFTGTLILGDNRLHFAQFYHGVQIQPLKHVKLNVGCIRATVSSLTTNFKNSRPMLDPWVSSVPIRPPQVHLDMLDVLEPIYWDTLGPCWIHGSVFSQFGHPRSTWTCWMYWSLFGTL